MTPPQIATLVAPHPAGGSMEHRYRPIASPRFDDAMHQMTNRSLGFNAEPAALLDAVAERRKPMAEVSFERGDWAQGFVRRCAVRACVAACTMRTLRDGVFYYSVVLAVPGRVGNLLDTDALADDYEGYLAPLSPAMHGPVVAAVRSELARLSSLDTRALLDFLKEIEVNEHLWPGDQVDDPDKAGRVAAAYARCGLLLGYPPATTAAMILHSLVGAPYGYS